MSGLVERYCFGDRDHIALRMMPPPPEHAKPVHSETPPVDNKVRAQDQEQKEVIHAWLCALPAMAPEDLKSQRRELDRVLDAKEPPVKSIEKLNQTYFLVDVGTDTVVGEEVDQSDGARRWTEFRFRSLEDFKRKQIKKFIKVPEANGKVKVVPLADHWLKHPRGRQYDRLVYAPEGSGVRVGPKDLNGWRGFTVEPAPGDWSLTRDVLIKQIICGNDEALFEWTRDWMANLFQRPGRHAETALFLTGKQGTGKNVFGSLVLGGMFDGRHFRVTTHTRQVLGEFNAILSGKCLLVVDEASLDTQTEYNAVKGLVTGHTIDVNRKGIDIDSELSMLHLVLLSNHEVPLKVDADDRRFAFYKLADTHANDIKFFGRIARELDEQGGRAAMLHELLARQVDLDALRFAPNTRAKQTAKRENWTSAQWFFFRMLRDVQSVGEWRNATDRTGGLLNLPLRRIKKVDAVLAYLNYLKETNVRREVKDARSELHNAIKKLVPAGWDYNRPVFDSRDYWTLPDLEVFQASFAQAVGCDIGDLLLEGSEPEPVEEM